MNKIEHLPINWTNGLKVDESHFLSNYHSGIEALYRSIGERLTSYNYGIGEPIDGQNESLRVEIDGETASALTVRLKTCSALTRGGLPILYYEGLYGDAVPTATLADSEYTTLGDTTFLVLVSVDPYEQVPIGEPNPKESPLRHPYILPKINLHIVPKAQVNKAFYQKNFLVIAEVESHGGAVSVNKQYIPPLQRGRYHNDVKTFIDQLGRSLRSIKKDIHLIYKRNTSDKRRDVLANNTFILCEAFNRNYNSHIFFIDHLAGEQPPIFVVQIINELANSLLSALQTLPETDKEELLQYYYEWTNITPSDFVRSMERVADVAYDHMDMAISLQTIGAFLTLLGKMFHKMSELEYIGMVHENIVVSDESVHSAPVQKKKTWSFLE